MKGCGVLVIALLFGVLIMPFVFASHITMQVFAVENDTAILLNVTNRGDEPAYQVQFVSTVFGRKYESKIKDVLAVGGSFASTLPINNTDVAEGTYPLLTTTHYQDANGYFFSAPFVTLVKNKVQVRSEVMVELNNAEIRTKQKIKASVRNFGDSSKTVNLSLFISDEFIVEGKSRTIELAPKSSEEAVFDIENFGARAGSTYGFYAVAEYDSDDKHYSSIYPASIKVLAEKKPFSPWIIGAALAVLVLIIILIQFKRRK